MIRITGNVILSLVFMGVGACVGYAVRDYFCPDSDAAVVSQIEKDGKKLADAAAETQVRATRREKIKTIISAVPADDQCIDRAIPADMADGLRNAFHGKRSATDSPLPKD